METEYSFYNSLPLKKKKQQHVYEYDFDPLDKQMYKTCSLLPLFTNCPNEQKIESAKQDQRMDKALHPRGR